MLTEQRYEIILQLLEEKKSITLADVRQVLGTSESTIRRDITALHNAGRLVKVFGGAVANEHVMTTNELTVAQKVEVNKAEKIKIARYAASLIEPEDFVFIDAGTTTGYMIDFITENSATFVTNAVAHAQRLVSRGMKVLLIGGELKSTTEAVVGNQAMLLLQNYHFTKGFFGTNGITRSAGFTTPDVSEAMIKRTAMGQCRQSYVLADYSKFDQVSSVTFGSFSGKTILTDREIEGYQECENVMTV